ncbi:MAG TPA: CBS domain-containing protein [Tepidiformaceae bacterium]|nr:CBS domain-containing protein [Tepidiformaceae bacterium]
MSEQRNIVVCPSCGSENIEGVDTCEHCTMDLRSIDVPESSQGVTESDLTLPVLSARMTRPRTVEASSTVREAVALMKDDPSGAVVIMDGVRIAGIFTDRDVLTRVAGRPGVMDEAVTRYMTPDPVVLREDDMMAVALNKMGDGGFRHMPVVRGAELVGMVTVRDVMNWVLGRYFD